MNFNASRLMSTHKNKSFTSITIWMVAFNPNQTIFTPIVRFFIFQTHMIWVHTLSIRTPMTYIHILAAQFDCPNERNNRISVLSRQISQSM
jgi:hypothetical protein